VVVVCSIENVDPMGVHTGDSVTVAPQQTLTDRQYQTLRDQAISVIRAVGVETGGSNVQFAVNPATDEIIVIEMNPRVSRSSALASKATGFPIAKIAARLAVGYTLDEIPNDITRVTPASFEPVLDYCVVKWPRFAFEKFPGVDERLSTHMKSVGEVMAIGRTFEQAFGKAMRSRELDSEPRLDADDATLLGRLQAPSAERYDVVLELLRRGVGEEEIRARTGIDLWFLRRMHTLATAPERVFAGQRTYRAVDTCAAEFAAETPYFYSSWERAGRDGPMSEVVRGDRPSVLILGSGPNRIGQGIEFDYCCVHAAMTVRESGRDAVMVNCNPETVSTDYDTSDRLYFEPLTLEDVLEVVHAEQHAGPVLGVVVQLGGQTPLGLAQRLKDAGVPIIGTSPEAIHLAEDRRAFSEVLADAGLVAPKHGTATSYEGARRIAADIGYPVLVRPSYVLGGRGMEIVYDDEQLATYMREATEVSADRPVLVDRFLDDAIEIDVDALFDGDELFLGGVMEHIEEAGIHSGDSACVLPPVTLGRDVVAKVREQTEALARGIGVRGLLNVQFAMAADVLYVLEANPRASRTAPFVSKATGVPLAKAAALVMVGDTIADLRAAGVLPAHGDGGRLPTHGGPVTPVAVKEAVLPFKRFRTVEGRGVDHMLGPEMRSTGEVMGIDANFGTAFAKSQSAAYGGLPTKGVVFVSMADRDKRNMIFPLKRMADLGFQVLATEGTADVLRRNGVEATVVRKHSHGRGPDGELTIVERILEGEVDMVVNTPSGPRARADGYEIRAAAIAMDRPIITTVQQLAAAVQGIEALGRGTLDVRSIQDWTAALREATGDTRS
jgi:carbamoyl-phosphate synthase large subunit